MSDDLVGRLLDERHCNDWYLRQSAAAALTEARASADHWYRIVETIATVIGLPEPEADFAGKVRDAFDELRAQLQDANGVADLAIKHKDAAESELSEARAEIVSLRVELGETKLVLEQTERNAAREIEGLRAELETSRSNCTITANSYLRRADAAESELSALRARVREVVGPFAEQASKYDPDEGDSHEHAWDRLDLTIGHLRAARQLMEDLK